MGTKRHLRTPRQTHESFLQALTSIKGFDFSKVPVLDRADILSFHEILTNSGIEPWSTTECICRWLNNIVVKAFDIREHYPRLNPEKSEKFWQLVADALDDYYDLWVTPSALDLKKILAFYGAALPSAAYLTPTCWEDSLCMIVLQAVAAWVSSATDQRYMVTVAKCDQPGQKRARLELDAAESPVTAHSMDIQRLRSAGEEMNHVKDALVELCNVQMAHLNNLAIQGTEYQHPFHLHSEAQSPSPLAVATNDSPTDLCRVLQGLSLDCSTQVKTLTESTKLLIEAGQNHAAKIETLTTKLNAAKREEATVRREKEEIRGRLAEQSSLVKDLLEKACQDGTLQAEERSKEGQKGIVDVRSETLHLELPDFPANHQEVTCLLQKSLDDRNSELAEAKDKIQEMAKGEAEYLIESLGGLWHYPRMVAPIRQWPAWKARWSG